ncbi:MAG: hypothetical protein WC150_08015 [Bacteroidia bacterium]
MKTNEIDSHTELVLQIIYLREVKQEQEAELKKEISEFVYSLSPVSIFKNSLKELVADKTMQQNLARVGVKVGISFIIQKIIRKNSLVSGLLSAVVTEKLSTVLTGNNLSAIVTGIGKLFTSPPLEKEEETVLHD